MKYYLQRALLVGSLTLVLGACTSGGGGVATPAWT